MGGLELDISSSFTQLGLSVSSNLSLKTYIHSIAKHASQKLGFLSRARGFFSPSQLPTIYKPQICPSLEYCSHFWGGAPRSPLHLLDKVQSKATRLIHNPYLPKSLHSLLSSSGCRSVYFLSSFSWKVLTGNQEYYSLSPEACSIHQKLYSITPFPIHTN